MKQLEDLEAKIKYLDTQYKANKITSAYWGEQMNVLLPQLEDMKRRY